ncbi:hypothetical protein GN244_ATG04857 [Phytophthora infestans]|uniref:Uncharacterized protein n=1 Tax=Phytophthora infestans TaxID=4787 RepID=A0A833T3V2_PHYIN|nr:hypothetical protein GN244_ATG04857 [Phytophthora infestans]
MQWRRLADQLMTTSWTHHDQQFNKLTDRLTSLWTTAQLTSVIESLQKDVDYSLDLHPDTEDVGRSFSNRGVE